MTPFDEVRAEIDGALHQYNTQGFYMDLGYTRYGDAYGSEHFPPNSLRKLVRMQAKHDKRPFLHVRVVGCFQGRGVPYKVVGYSLRIPKLRRTDALAAMFVVAAAPLETPRHVGHGDGVWMRTNKSAWVFKLAGEDARGLFDVWREAVKSQPHMRAAIGLPPLPAVVSLAA